jgi:hypothetical protein
MDKTTYQFIDIKEMSVEIEKIIRQIHPNATFASENSFVSGIPKGLSAWINEDQIRIATENVVSLLPVSSITEDEIAIGFAEWLDKNYPPKMVLMRFEGLTKTQLYEAYKLNL